MTTAHQSYVVEIDGEDAGVLTREAGERSYRFYAASRRFDRLEGGAFASYRDAERAAAALAGRPAGRRSGSPTRADGAAAGR